jgi:prepilin-type N-terminal cleavage/methylation domain-containing protein
MSFKNDSGFTTIELLTVIALLGILAGLAIVSMGNPREFQSLAQAEALKANLRFTQSKAMSDLPGNVWSLNITAANYTIQRNGGVPNPAVNLPGSNSGTYTLPTGQTISGGTGLVRFNFRGQPVDALGTPLASATSVTLYGAPSITVTQGTGFIP